MKKQARAEAARLGEWVRVAVARVRGQSVLMAAKARGARTQARRKVTAARRAGREKVQVRAAQARKTVPGQARIALGKRARTVGPARTSRPPWRRKEPGRRLGETCRFRYRVPDCR